eukprot:3617777-Rhodomonas_salina.1
MITLRLDKLTDPLAKAYLTVPDFLDYLKASMQYEIIRQRSLPRNPVGRAWRKSYDEMRRQLTVGGNLTLDVISESVELAESHLRELTPEQLQAQAAAQPNEPEKPDKPAGGGKSKKKSAEATKAAHVRRLKAQLSKLEGGSSTPASPIKPSKSQAGTTPNRNAGKAAKPGSKCAACEKHPK